MRIGRISRLEEKIYGDLVGLMLPVEIETMSEMAQPVLIVSPDTRSAVPKENVSKLSGWFGQFLGGLTR